MKLGQFYFFVNWVFGRLSFSTLSIELFDFTFFIDFSFGIRRLYKGLQSLSQMENGIEDIIVIQISDLNDDSWRANYLWNAK